ncbi:MAG: xylulokinase [Deinococcales bacterium]
MAKKLALGLDLGTSGVDVLAVDEDGLVIAESHASYPLLTPQPGWTEQRSEDWWQGVLKALKTLREKLPEAEIIALGLTGQMHGMVALDAQGEAVRPALLWNDQRTGDYIAEIEAAIPRKDLIQRTGNPAITGFQLAKVLWLRGEEPENFARTRHILLPKDFIGYKLTGNMAAEPADASGSNCYNLLKRDWDHDILTTLKLNPNLYPQVARSHDVVGRLKPDIAQETGLPSDLPIIAGAGDNAAAGIGLGLSSANLQRGSVSLGTSGVIFAPLKEPTPDPEGRVHLFAHGDGGFNLLAVTLSAAGSLQWFHDTLSPDTPFELLNQEASQSPVGSRGLCFKPYLAGERTPHMNPHLRGSWHGLSLAANRGDIVRSIMEGVACSLREGLDLIKPLNPLTELLTTGGGSKSPLWMDIMTNTLALPLHSPKAELGAAYGAALLAFQGVGLTEEAVKLAKVDIARRYEPNQGFQADYENLYKRYQALI